MALLHRLQCERGNDGHGGDGRGERRFVLHRHRDAGGEHLDLRLEQDGYLMGFRVDGPALNGTVWASVKTPHPLSWLARDGDAIREDEGTYFWDSGDASKGVLVLCGQRDTVSISVDAVDDLCAGALAGVREAAERLGVSVQALVGLAEDGVVARERAIARFCGLGRELDGDAFDDGLWRKTLAGERLAVIQQYLHGLEVRFDRKYPPMPVSMPVNLEDDEDRGDAGRAMAILRS